MSSPMKGAANTTSKSLELTAKEVMLLTAAFKYGTLEVDWDLAVPESGYKDRKAAKEMLRRLKLKVSGTGFQTPIKTANKEIAASTSENQNGFDDDGDGESESPTKKRRVMKVKKAVLVDNDDGPDDI